MVYTVGEMAKLLGVTPSTLRYYEQIGIIAPIARDPSSGHRAYTDEDIQSLVTISCLSATGMPLDAMREYLKNRFDGTEGARRQMALLDAQALRLAAKAECSKPMFPLKHCIGVPWRKAMTTKRNDFWRKTTMSSKQ